MSTSKSSQGNRDELCAHLNALARCEARVATELLIDTGRRPEEAHALPQDCLARDSDGAPVLAHENRKANRRSGGLPIAEAARRSDANGRVSAWPCPRDIADQVAVLYLPPALPDPLAGVGTAVELRQIPRPGRLSPRRSARSAVQPPPGQPHGTWLRRLAQPVHLSGTDVAARSLVGACATGPSLGAGRPSRTCS
jgi:hypothetical protein